MKLTLHVRKKYFDEIKSGKKLEEYRLATPYWRRRIIGPPLRGENIDSVLIALGYPPKTDTSRFLERKWNGFLIKSIIHPEFGNKPVMVYAIDVSVPFHRYSIPDPNCPTCLGSGVVDTGGFTPWGTPIYDKCSCIHLPADSKGGAQ